MYIAPNDSLGSEQREGILIQRRDELGPVTSNFTQIALDGAKVDGKIYEIPESMKAVSMFYNKSTVTTAARDHRRPPRPGQGRHQDRYRRVRLGLLQLVASSTHSAAAPLMDSTGKCTAETDRRLRRPRICLKALKDTGNVTFYTDGPTFQGDFKTGKTDIVIDGPWETGDFEKALTANLGIAEIPAGPKGKFLPMTAPDGWYINVNPERRPKLWPSSSRWEVRSRAASRPSSTQAGHLPRARRDRHRSDLPGLRDPDPRQLPAPPTSS